MGEHLRQALVGVGHDVRVFGDVEAALAAFADQPPDLFVTDVVLPGATGIELVRAVRLAYGRLELPVVVVSSLDRMDDVARGYEAGADDYMLKPVQADELCSRVELLLNRRLQARGDETVRWTRYQLLGQLGKGQVATTYRARRRGDQRDLALKALPRDADAPVVARLLAEAELLRRLDDVPGIVRVRDVGVDGARAYYAMELLAGQTLRQRLDQGPALEPFETAAIVRSLAVSLAALERREVVHGDVKPANVILGEEEVVLIDFGLAHRAGETPPGRGGTLAYVAPEVLKGGESSYQSDLYALGVILYEGLAGRLPWTASGAALAAQKIEGAEPDLTPLLEADAAPGLIAVIEEVLVSDPRRRTARAEEVATALLPYAASG